MELQQSTHLLVVMTLKYKTQRETICVSLSLIFI